MHTYIQNHLQQALFLDNFLFASPIFFRFSLSPRNCHTFCLFVCKNLHKKEKGVMEDGCDKQKIYVSCVWHSLCLFLSIKQSVVDISTHHNYGGGGSSNLIFDYTLMRFRRINGWGHGAKGKSEAKERERRLRLKWSAVQFILVEPLHSHDFIKAQIWNLISDWKILMIIPNLQSLKRV